MENLVQLEFEKTLICDTLKLAYNKGWISTRDGNASLRRKGEDCFFVTPSGVRKQHLDSDMMVKLRFVDSEEHELNMKWKHITKDTDDRTHMSNLSPTGELALHAMLQCVIQEDRVVLHLHPTYTVAAMFAGLDLQDVAREFPEINRHTRVGPVIPKLEPGSEELGYATAKALNLKVDGTVDYDIVGLMGHGIVAIAKDPWTAFEHVERLEHICQIVLAAIPCASYFGTRTA